MASIITINNGNFSNDSLYKIQSKKIELYDDSINLIKKITTNNGTISDLASFCLTNLIELDNTEDWDGISVYSNFYVKNSNSDYESPAATITFFNNDTIINGLDIYGKPDVIYNYFPAIGIEYTMYLGIKYVQIPNNATHFRLSWFFNKDGTQYNNPNNNFYHFYKVALDAKEIKAYYIKKYYTK